MEFAAFVALGAALTVLGLASTELAKVFSGPGSHIGEELHLDPA